jgi:putative ABC transport system permease protein
MPQEDSFFQTVGAPAGVGPSAPPDNVLIVPDRMFAKLVVGEPIVRQVHVSFDHSWLSQDPAAAAGQVTAARNHLETELTGAALVGDNIGAALSAAREDALYGQLLFLLLGVPSFVVALSVTALVITVRGERRVRELSLLRIRGASGVVLSTVVAGEAAIVLAGGLLLGWPAAVLAGHWAFGTGRVAWGWFAAGAGMLVLVVSGALASAARRSLRRDADALQGVRTVEVPLAGRPWPLRVYADLALLAGAAVVFWLVARGGYQVVVVPEGVPTTSVNWAALLAPALAWPGLALFVWRLVDLASGRLRTPREKDGAELIRAAVRRRRRTVARGATVLAVAIGVAGSTAVFTATYREQSRLDVALTVGADVAMALPSDPTQASRLAAKARQAPAVRASSVQTHRYAYVGNDLQDFYGIDPTTISAATPLRDAFVPGGTIASDLQQLQAHPDGVLLSAETLHDYQLHPGDSLRLRLQAGPSQQYTAIPFTVLGQVSEWPTAPKDSFIVANNNYASRMTQQPGAPTLLLSSTSPLRTANSLRTQLGAAAHVNDITTARSSVTTTSGLAATDLGGLARLQLGFGVLFAVSGFGLALLIGVLQRRRAVVLLGALGATGRQRGRFLAAEARTVLVGGLLGGVAIGTAIAVMLVRVMTGIFDPPPDHAVVPWTYVTLLGVAVTLTAVFVVVIVGGWAGRAGPRELRDL